MLDSTKKRLNFVDSVITELGLNGETLHMRAEEAGKAPRHREKYDVSLARAVANMQTLSEYCLPFVKIGGVFAAMKGAKAAQELAVSKGAIEKLGGQILTSTEFTLPDCGERTILTVKKISQTPPKFPRPSAQISKKPLE